LVEKRIVQNILGHRDLACSAAQCATSGRYSEAKRGKKCANSEVF
jgi:HJR/Mrr/RecB family endonuclease